MKRNVLFVLMFILFLLPILTSSYKIKPAGSTWTGTVYIRADGSIDPPDAPIVTYDNVTYTLTDNITSSGDGIIIERDNIIIDGAYHALIGAEAGIGINLSSRIGVTVKNATIKNFQTGILLWNSCGNNIYKSNIVANTEYGIYLECSDDNNITQNNIESNVCGICILDSCDNNLIVDNNLRVNEDGIYLKCSSFNRILKNSITRNQKGIFLEISYNNSIVGNTIARNQYAITLRQSNGNSFYHNNFIDNDQQVDDWSPLHLSINTWDLGYPSGGNYWSDHIYVDLHSGPYQNETGSDGIGDTTYIIYGNNVDNYPLVGKFYDFEVILKSEKYHVEIISNSTVSDCIVGVVLDDWPPYLPLGQVFIEFSVEGIVNTTIFCRITIPRAIFKDTYTVLVLIDQNYEEIPSYELPASNTTHAYLCFSYEPIEQKHNIVIVPEFSAITLATFSLFMAIAISLRRELRKFKR